MWWGAGAVQAARTASARASRGTGPGTEAADRAPGVDRLGRRLPEQVLLGGADQLAGRCRRRRRLRAPRTIATGTPSALPITRPLAAAISSARATMVASSTRPPASFVPRRSIERRQAGGADRHVHDAAPPGPAERVGDDDGDRDAEARRQRGPDALGAARPGPRAAASGTPRPRSTRRRPRWRRRTRAAVSAITMSSRPRHDARRLAPPPPRRGRRAARGRPCPPPCSRSSA